MSKLSLTDAKVDKMISFYSPWT